MKRKHTVILWIGLCCLLLIACTSAPEIAVGYDPATLRFEGQAAFDLEQEFVTTFTNRDSGTENNTRATEWIRAHFEKHGWTCQYDEWVVINYSRPLPLRNVECELAGKSQQQILVVAHHDQAPTTIQGADNDGSGIAIMLQLAEIFASEGQPKYTLTFLSSDGEEFGLFGTRRYLKNHPNTADIIAGFSLDNLGKKWYTAMKLETQGLYRNYGALWLKLAVQEAVNTSDDLVDIVMDDIGSQILNQAVPIGAMDQAAMIAAGIPAIGFARFWPPEYGKEIAETYHTPADTIEFQDPEILGQSGRVAEASIRQLLSMDTFPSESGPYLYFDRSRKVFRGIPLLLTFISFVSLFLLGSLSFDRNPLMEKVRNWSQLFPHYLGIWLPLLAAIASLHLFVAIGLMDKFAVWPGYGKDPAWYTPRWPAILLFFGCLVVFLYLGRRIARAVTPTMEGLQYSSVKGLALFIIGLAGLLALLRNPFSLVIMLPLLFWFLIRGRQKVSRILDVIFFLLGGLVVYPAIYFLAFVVWPLKFYVFWYLLMMFSIPTMIGIPTVLIVTSVLAAGLSMVITPPFSAGRI